MTNRFKLSEAATAILEGSKEAFDSNIAAKRGPGDKGGKLSASVAYGTHDAGIVGKDVDKMDDELPDYLKGTPSATPPGATPPVGAEKMSRLKGQPQETMGRTDVMHPAQADANQFDAIRDRIAGKPPKQTMQANPGATFQSYSENLDMSDDVKALLEGENLSEEFKQKATTIFEAAVMSRIEVIAEEVEKQLVEQFESAVEEIKEELAGKVDEYLNYMVNEWMEQNELAIENGLRSEIAEDFIGGLRNLFIEHYIDIPEDKVDVVSEMAGKVAELEDALNEQINKGIALTKELNEQKKVEAVYEACDGLTQTQVEKLKSLAEGVEFTTEDEFATKLETLKSSYFKEDYTVATDSALDDEVLIEEEKKTPRSSDPSIDQYVAGISKSLK
jgi:hypothetical protein